MTKNREFICQDLDVALLNDEERKTVTGWGAGSSFNQGIWQEPEIYMNRWRAYIGHGVLAEAVRDEELVKLAREIFGDVIDVDYIVDSIEK